MRVFDDMWAYLTEASNWSGSDGIAALLGQQLLLTVTALLMAMAVGLPVALWLGHLGRGGFLAINISNVGRAIPTFALLAMLVVAPWPGTAELGPYGRAGLATLIALTLFALPPIITNSYVAMREVPAEVCDAARGMGMTGAQQFWRVELPLGLPLVVSGLRLALVQVWATATIAALVAGPGLGQIITDGFFRSNYGKGIAGALVVAAVALVLELLAAMAQRAVDTTHRGTPAGGRTDAMSVTGATVERPAESLGRRRTSGHAQQPLRDTEGTSCTSSARSRRSSPPAPSPSPVAPMTTCPATTPPTTPARRAPRPRAR